MNLHSIVSGPISAVNPSMLVSVQVSTGSAKSSDGTRTPTYAPAVTVRAQVQPVTFRDIQQLEGLNLQGVRKAIYLNGEIDGLVRVTNQGGDLITFPDGSVWLVVMILEAFSQTAGWTKAAITLQNGS
jgi:hypothetical protein